MGKLGKQKGRKNMNTHEGQQGRRTASGCGNLLGKRRHHFFKRKERTPVAARKSSIPNQNVQQSMFLLLHP
jgi:hypothetical protein